MECNNKFCFFNAFNQCCHESEEGFEKAKPNQLDCPSSIRSDLEKNLYKGINEVINLSMTLKHKEIQPVINFIKEIKNEM